MKEHVHKAMYEVDEIFDRMELLVYLYLKPLSKDFYEYINRLKENVRQSGTNIDKHIDALEKSNNDIDLPRIEYLDKQFRLSQRNLLKKEGYSYF